MHEPDTSRHRRVEREHRDIRGVSGLGDGTGEHGGAGAGQDEGDDRVAVIGDDPGDQGDADRVQRCGELGVARGPFGRSDEG